MSLSSYMETQASSLTMEFQSCKNPEKILHTLLCTFPHVRAQRVIVECPRSHSQQMTRPGLEPGSTYIYVQLYIWRGLPFSRSRGHAKVNIVQDIQWNLCFYGETNQTKFIASLESWVPLGMFNKMQFLFTSSSDAHSGFHNLLLMKKLKGRNRTSEYR